LSSTESLSIVEAQKTGLQVLQEARYLVADPAHWTRLMPARDAKGLFVLPTDPGAVCFCIVGAIMRAAGSDRSPAFQEAHGALRDAIAPIQGIGFGFNDNPKTTHADVLRAIDRAIFILWPSPGVQ
jgi:hypothetical protein